ncbi:MAG: hypothetical protein JSS10_09655 [Verrucomicrobia bacterium]|nr:hypothetical protein [Verrucomicrobiota bacterium]
MKKLLWTLACLIPFASEALEVEKQIENEKVCVLKVRLEAGEEIGLHRDEYPRVVIGLQGGTVHRIEQGGACKEIEFPTGKAVYLEADPVGEQHRAVNKTDQAIEVIVVQIK